MNVLKQVWAAIRGRFQKPTLEIEPDSADATVADAPESNISVGLNNAVDFHTLLDELPYHFETLKALRKFDRDAYDMFSILGAPICTDASVMYKNMLPPGFVEDAPMLRTMFMANNSTLDQVPMRVGYILRHEGGRIYVGRNGQSVSLPSGLCYRLVGYWHSEDSKPFMGSCYIHVSSDGTCRIVPETFHEKQTVAGSAVTRKVTRIPHWVDLVENEVSKLKGEATVLNLFRLVAACKLSSDSILVRASKGVTSCAWSVARNDAKRFFRDRECGRTETGQRKRVLHYVAPFTRTVRGKTQHVAEHYRGDRIFTWSGYTIHVAGLNFHHRDVFESQLSSVAASPELRGNRAFISTRRFAREVMRMHINQSYKRAA